MNYLKAEHLKFKRTISNKLLFICAIFDGPLLHGSSAVFMASSI